MRPIDVASRETTEFVQRHLPPGTCRILEVGCGSGEVAARLQRVGHQVIAIDSDANAIEQARRLGIDARVAQWPDMPGENERAFDAILFARSLHHISPLASAVARAHDLLKPTGLLLVEDFAYDDIDLPTSEWCYGIAVLLKVCGTLLPEKAFLTAFVESGGDFAFWHQHHDHELHSAPAILGALTQAFPLVAESEIAYLYRYFLPVLPETEQGYAVAAHLVDLEKRMGSVGNVQLIGRQFVARKQTAEIAPDSVR